MTAAQRPDQAARWLMGPTASMAIGGFVLLGILIRPYWVAKYRGNGANLRGALLIRAPLADRRLRGADLGAANLGGADLARAWLMEANLKGAGGSGTSN